MLQILGAVVILLGVQCSDIGAPVGKQKVGTVMCKGRSDIHSTFDNSTLKGYQYTVTIKRRFTNTTIIVFELDENAKVTLDAPPLSKITEQSHNTYQITFEEPSYGVKFVVKSLTRGKIPYFKSVNINNSSVCRPLKGMFDHYIVDEVIPKYESSTSRVKYFAKSCGKRLIDHTELIVNGENTRPGEWPWHSAIFRIEQFNIRYVCGGTLISENFVLTAAHCVTSAGQRLLPESVNVGLGRYKLIGNNVGAQEREVHKIFVHGQFSTKILDNDIALLKLRTTVTFGDYIQPACLWNQKTESLLRDNELFGTVVGWGFDQTDALSSHLQKVVLPKLSFETCVRDNPLFYSKVLSGKKFCAGYKNGTSPCNGDSGGSFAVFVPESAVRSPSTSLGSWHVRGIVSLSVARNDAAVCDPHQNAVFTDVALYETWIADNMTE